MGSGETISFLRDWRRTVPEPGHDEEQLDLNFHPNFIYLRTRVA